jgi:hypothetical protein
MEDDDEMMDSRKTIPALLTALLLLTIPSFGQTPSEQGQLRGIAKDPAQALISGAQVVLTDQRTQVKVTAFTDSEGSYLFSSLQPGVYLVDVGKKGFNNSASTELKLTAGQTARFDVRPSARRDRREHYCFR